MDGKRKINTTQIRKLSLQYVVLVCKNNLTGKNKDSIRFYIKYGMNDELQIRNAYIKYVHAVHYPQISHARYYPSNLFLRN